MELKEYLRALFKPGDTVNFVVSSFEKDGKFLPSGKGANKFFEELIKACDTYEDIGYILGDWNPKAGAWARINPMSGEGCKNSDVAEFRHCLIESDTLPKEEQLKKIYELNLPWSASLCLFGKLLRYKGMKNIQTERIIPKIILVRILSIHPYAVLVGSN